ncbi:MAG TPA: PAS domain-containing sensor histidine kinase [Thermodesulfobacteriota bacterium]|jgi:PAS domain S-box-containing protein
MKKSQDKPVDAAALRRRAKERLKEKPAATGQPLAEADLRRLQHELEVHQIELEMQNEELQQAQAEIEAALGKYTDLYDFAPVGYFTLAGDGTILAVNLTGTRLLGIERARLLNRRFAFLVSEAHRPAFDAFLKKVFESQTQETCELALLKEGDRPLYAHIEAIVSEDGQECRAAVADITERMRADEKLKTAYAHLERQSAILAQQAKMSAIGVLVAGVAHELNNPLMAMLHFAQYCLKHTAEDDRCYSVLQDIEHETRRCIDIVKNLLTFSHSGDGRKEKYELKNPAEILERVVRLLSYRIEKEGVSITSHVDEETPKIPMRVNAIQDVILNLLTNALDALVESKKKEVHIDVHPDGDGVLLSIADSGIGISPEVLGNIYDPFFTTKPVGKGTGLGLSLCQSIIHAHGGEITCESEPDKGTVFHAFIPTQRRKGAKRDETHFSY